MKSTVILFGALSISGISGMVSAKKTPTPINYETKYGKVLFKKFIEPIPVQFRTQIVEAAEEKLKKGGLKNFFVTKLAEKDSIDAQYPFELIALAYGVEPQLSTKKDMVHFFSDVLMSGSRADVELSKAGKLPLELYDGANQQEFKNEDARRAFKKELIPLLFDHYKIHLMPLEHDKLRATIQLLKGLQTDPELRTLINQFKVTLARIPYTQAAQSAPEQNAVLVIYPTGGKHNVQKALNKIYTLFKGFLGMNVRPRYNARVNDLIWISQGDGGVKGDRFAQYYDADRVYYNPEKFDYSGEDPVLKHPETQKRLTGRPDVFAGTTTIPRVGSPIK